MDSFFTYLADPLLEQIQQRFQAAKRIALLAHYNPDGDCLGSVLGLMHILQLMGKEVVPVCADPAPASFLFLPGVEQLRTDLGEEDFDLVVALDAGDLSRYGSVAEKHRDYLQRVSLLNIDHHQSSGGCGQVNVIDVAAASTTEMLALIQRQAGFPINTEAAICLLTGLMTDSGSFQFSNASERAFAVASYLVGAGAETEVIAEPIFRSHTFAQSRLRSQVILQAQRSCNDRLIYSYVNTETLAKLDIREPMDDGSIGALRDVIGVEVAIIFKSYQEPNVTRLSLRSVAPFDCATFCQRFSGGGHARAAGATVNLPLEETMRLVLPELERALLAEG